MQYLQVPLVACLTGGFQCTLCCLMTTATSPAPIVALNPLDLLLFVQLLKISTVVQEVLIIFTVWTLGLSFLFLTVSTGYRL